VTRRPRAACSQRLCSTLPRGSVSTRGCRFQAAYARASAVGSDSAVSAWVAATHGFTETIGGKGVDPDPDEGLEDEELLPPHAVEASSDAMNQPASCRRIGSSRSTQCTNAQTMGSRLFPEEFSRFCPLRGAPAAHRGQRESSRGPCETFLRGGVSAGALTRVLAILSGPLT